MVLCSVDLMLFSYISSLFFIFVSFYLLFDTLSVMVQDRIRSLGKKQQMCTQIRSPLKFVLIASCAQFSLKTQHSNYITKLICRHLKAMIDFSPLSSRPCVSHRFYGQVYNRRGRRGGGLGPEQAQACNNNETESSCLAGKEVIGVRRLLAS